MNSSLESPLTKSDSPLLANLNEAQKQAVTHGDGPLLIVAGAGSGKTRVITRRVAYLAIERRVDPRSLLAITFTNKAAREMKERIWQWVPRRDLWVSTFHAMCARILRMEIEALGFGKDFTIYDTSDRDQLLREILRDQGYDTTAFRPSQVGSTISHWKNKNLKPEEVQVWGGFAEQVSAKVWTRYETRMRALNALDFDDLLLKTAELLEKTPEVRERFQRRFEHVLVDEYQDTNSVQYQLTKLLVGSRKNVCCCGDPDQSIYKWRGAEISNILDFEKDFGQVTVVKLEQNYRSTRTILGASEALIQHNRSRKAKTLWTENPQGDPIVLLHCHDEEEESREIAAQIRSLRSQGRNYKDIAIFYRVNFLQRALEMGLRHAAIPYQVFAGVEFFERKEIKDLMGYLRILVNPKDDLSFLRLVNVPPRGIGATSVTKLQEFAARLGIPLREAISKIDSHEDLPVKAKSSFKALGELLNSLQAAATMSASEALQNVVEKTNFLDYVSKLDGIEEVDRSENVQELLNYAMEYDRRDPEGKLAGFLAEVSLMSDTDQSEENLDRVSLMTLHSAKGLEFPVVFIAGIEEGLLPHARSLQKESDLEEERRLCYVGITRAQQKLFLTCTRSRQQYGTRMPQGPSRFLNEIPKELIEGAENESFHETEQEEWKGSEVLDRTSQQEEFVPERAPKSPDANAPEPGERVKHEHFGYGRVVSLQGSGVNTRILIDFEHLGTKMLLLPYANLQRVGRSS